MRFVYIGQTTKDPFDLCAHNNSDENQTDLPMECFIIVQGQSEAKASGYLDPASPTAIFVHYSCMNFHEEKKPMLCST